LGGRVPAGGPELSERRRVEGLGVVGAGTMGAGIAQVAALGGFETYLHDPFPAALERGVVLVNEGLSKGAERGRWSADDAEAAGRRLHAVAALEGLSPCQLVIEAAPEDLELKRDLFARLSEICGPDVLLATNTSSLLVTAMATAAAHPENVIGMHFFNPAPLMSLLEVVAGSESSEEAIATGRAVGERMGKRVIIAADGPGFLANRCARPFGMEALKLLREGAADHATIDRIVRMGGSFRMGPFELSDLVGIDVGFEVSKSFYEQSFHEPRWRPSPIQARMVAAGRFGRKSGRGYYDYSGEGSHRDEDPEPPEAAGEGTVAIEGDGPLADELRSLAEEAGFDLRPIDGARNGKPSLIVDASVWPSPPEEDETFGESGTTVCLLCADGSLAELDAAGGAVGFHALPPLSETRGVELTKSSNTTATAAERAEAFFRSLGKHVEWVGDAPGLVLARIVCQLVNEAAFALSEGIGSAEDIDAAMKLGFNYPRGPLEWADTIELDHVLAVLDALYDELHEERYRAAPLLRRMVAEGRVGRSVGEGFFRYQ
jgi:3-hydroxybutyryl-CoA dehydrogenase